MVVKKADPDVAPTTSGSKSKNSNISIIPDHYKLDNALRNFTNRHKIDNTIEELVVGIPEKEGWKNYLYKPKLFEDLKSHGHDIATHSNIFISSGTFKKRSIKEYRGRTVENLERILFMPLDADLIDYLEHKKSLSLDGSKKRKELLKELHNKSDAELNNFLAEHLSFIKSVLRKAGLGYSEILVSGYGHYFLLYIDPKDQRKREKIRDVHKDIVAIINKVAGYNLFDIQCTDAGTRVIRLENSFNLKNPNLPRPVRVIERGDK